MTSHAVHLFGDSQLLRAELWAMALDDAEMHASRAALFVLPGRSATGNQAMSWLPGPQIGGSEELHDFGELARIANAAHTRRLHRVAIWPAQLPREVCAALLRHELEHSRQFDRHGAAARDLFEDAVDVLVEHAGGVDGAGVLYQHIPMEGDADAAASTFVRRVFGDAAVDIHEESHWSLLARTRNTPDPATIRTRMDRFVRLEGPVLADRFALAVSAGADPKSFRRLSE